MNGLGPDPHGRESAGPNGPEPPSVSVVVPCIGRPATVRRCLSALLRHTRKPWRLIAVARSERDVIGSYLSGIADASSVPVDVLLDPDARSLREAWRDGLARARGEFVAILGPGGVVTDAWLDQLVALASSDPAIGVVAPMSNAAAGSQRAGDVAYADPAERLVAFARQRSDWGGACASRPRGSRASACSSAPVPRTRCAPAAGSPLQRQSRDGCPRPPPDRAVPGPRGSTRLRSGPDRGVADQKARIPCGRTSAGTGRTVGDDGTSDNVPSTATRKT